ncbi:hypothetical protein [Zoogloea dura]|uniref:Uncharacterized protein n=1 Tax=Zoogloea dura TaxID=2728840 RepID=A0A848G4V8_9RHOO|nr:hypothetical protein [Zoogloea dura]NML26299.1 hypothetical protein [Zoogloea dura]
MAKPCPPDCWQALSLCSEAGHCCSECQNLDVGNLPDEIDLQQLVLARFVRHERDPSRLLRAGLR